MSKETVDIWERYNMEAVKDTAETQDTQRQTAVLKYTGLWNTI